MSHDAIYTQTKNVDDHLKLAWSNAESVLQQIKGRAVTKEEVREYLIKRLDLSLARPA